MRYTPPVGPRRSAGPADDEDDCALTGTALPATPVIAGATAGPGAGAGAGGVTSGALPPADAGRPLCAAA